MAITNLDGIVAALASNAADRIIIDKNNLANQVVGRMCSLWRATGQPGQGAIPATPALCTKALAGCLGFTNQTDPVKTYIGWLFCMCSNNAMTLEIHDRLIHNGGLVLNVTTAQTITGLDLLTLAVPADRVGADNYSDVQWWLEVYADGGATASNATINVTYDDGTTGNLTVVAVGGTIRIGQMIALTSLIPTAQQGKFIRGINSVTLSASTGTAGSFGFTATRPRTALPLAAAYLNNVGDFASLGLPLVPNDACLVPLIMPSTTSSGSVRGGGKIIHG